MLSSKPDLGVAENEEIVVISDSPFAWFDQRVLPSVCQRKDESISVGDSFGEKTTLGPGPENISVRQSDEKHNLRLVINISMKVYHIHWIVTVDKSGAFDLISNVIFQQLNQKLSMVLLIFKHISCEKMSILPTPFQS